MDTLRQFSAGLQAASAQALAMAKKRRRSMARIISANFRARRRSTLRHNGRSMRANDGESRICK
jgi:hypothetical protein